MFPEKGLTHVKLGLAPVVNPKFLTRLTCNRAFPALNESLMGGGPAMASNCNHLLTFSGTSPGTGGNSSSSPQSFSYLSVEVFE